MDVRRWTAVMAGLVAGSLPAAACGNVDYLRDVKPLLVAKCSRCHGPLKQESGLRIDTVALLKKGGDRGPAIVPGKATDSVLVQALHGTGDVLRMPKEAPPLTEPQIAIVAQWIDQGAVAPADEKPIDPLDHWSLREPKRAPVPIVKRPLWTRGPLDSFIAAEHDRHGIAGQQEAPRAALLRRLSFDLIGLPPTPTELHEYLEDPSPDAYERVVDRLLASPQHGERWARHWMDVWRYSDWAGWTDGGQIRDSQPHIWRWRDWIVEALNADKPYDRMVVEMLAADELQNTDVETLRATGFLVRNYKMLSRETWMQDVVEHTGKAFLGLTLNCARCHDHMYDPITQEDYYHFRAIFEPHQVRIDRVTGQLNTKLDGLPRVYDADLTAKTHVFERGDDRKPDTRRTIGPAAPTIFGAGALTVQPVALPVESYVPDLRRHVREDLLRQASADLEKAKSELAKWTDAVCKLSDAAQQSPPTAASAAALQGPCDAVALAAQRLVAANAQRLALLARIAADEKRFATPPAADAAEAARQAALAERQAEVASAAAELLECQQAIVKFNRGDAKTQPQLPEAEKKLSAAQARVSAAQSALANPGDKYTPLGPTYPKQSSGRRLALARWIVRPDNPLAARVAVNHVWLRHFGVPLVPTVSDFGKNGKPPTHPELLDWLAVELMAIGQQSEVAGPGGALPADAPGLAPRESALAGQWRMKHLHRLLVTSATYRQSSSLHPPSAPLDPHVYARWQPRRVEAETVRDAVLFASGRLDLAQRGAEIDCKEGLTSPRRSLYFRHAPEKQMEFLKLFDAAAPTQCYQRQESVMPQQALALVNSQLVLAESRRLARSLTAEAADPAAFVAAAFERLISRPPTPAESQECVTFLGSQTELLVSQSARLTHVAASLADVEKPARDPALRARENLVQVLMNHHEFVTVP